MQSLAPIVVELDDLLLRAHPAGDFCHDDVPRLETHGHRFYWNLNGTERPTHDHIASRSVRRNPRLVVDIAQNTDFEAGVDGAVSTMVSKDLTTEEYRFKKCGLFANTIQVRSAGWELEEETLAGVDQLFAKLQKAL